MEYKNPTACTDPHKYIMRCIRRDRVRENRFSAFVFGVFCVALVCFSLAKVFEVMAA